MNINGFPMTTSTTSKNFRQSFPSFSVCACILLGLNSQLALARAEENSPLHIHLVQFKVDSVSGARTAQADAATVAPGDALEYRATYSNRGAQVLSVDAVLPIPENMEYVPGSANQLAGLQYQVAQQDRQFDSEPLMKMVTDVKGASKQVAVPYADYRFVRWGIGKIAPGTAIEVSMRAKVSSASVPAVTP
jgi:uncharacterized repeat protein (TIGR01451 family)